LLNNPLVAAT